MTKTSPKPIFAGDEDLGQNNTVPELIQHWKAGRSADVLVCLAGSPGTTAEAALYLIDHDGPEFQRAFLHFVRQHCAR